MKSSKIRWITVAAVSLMAATGASAQGTWNLGTTSTNASACNVSASSCLAGNGQAGGAGIGTLSGISATMTAYSNWNGTAIGNFTAASLTENDTSGYGARSTGESSSAPHHAFDNISSATAATGGTQEFMLISFGSDKVNLSSLQIGYSQNQADMSIYRWDGNAADVTGTTLNGSWSLVSSMDAWNNGAACTNPNGSGGCKQFNAGSGLVSGGTANLDKYSSWWLISTYMGGAATHGLDGSKNDSFKLLSFTATLCADTLSGGSTGGTGGAATNGNGSTCGPSQGSAPEPGSLALVGLALSGVYAVRRRPLAVAKTATV